MQVYPNEYKTKKKVYIQNILKSINQHKYVINLLSSFKLLNLFEFKLDLQYIKIGLLGNIIR